MRATLVDLQEKLIGLQSHCFETEEENRKLRLKLEDIDNRKAEADRWELTELANELYAYKMKTPTAAEAKVRACHHCFQKHKISMIQRPSQNDHRRVCHECGFQFVAVHLESQIAYGSLHGRSFVDFSRD